MIACYHSVQNLLSSSWLPENLNTKMYKTIILLVVLCVCETWSLTLREVRRLRVFENRVLRRIFGHKRGEVTGEWKENYIMRSLMISTPHSVLLRVIKSRIMRWAWHVARMMERRCVYRVLVGKPEGKGPLGTPRRRWEYNIKINLQEVGYEEWTGSVWLKIGTDGGNL